MPLRAERQVHAWIGPEAVWTLPLQMQSRLRAPALVDAMFVASIRKAQILREVSKAFPGVFEEPVVGTHEMMQGDVLEGRA